MKLVFLASSASGLIWFRRYYAESVPEGGRKARVQFEAMKQVLKANPFAGRAIEGRRSRLYVIPRTPFGVIYRIGEDRIEVLAVHDLRSDPSRPT